MASITVSLSSINATPFLLVSGLLPRLFLLRLIRRQRSGGWFSYRCNPQAVGVVQQGHKQAAGLCPQYSRIPLHFLGDVDVGRYAAGIDRIESAQPHLGRVAPQAGADVTGRVGGEERNLVVGEIPLSGDNRTAIVAEFRVCSVCKVIGRSAARARMVDGLK